MPHRGTVLVVGETLVDRVAHPDGQHREHVGGSPANVAFGLGALDHVVELATCFATDERGQRIVQKCARHGVRLTPGSEGAEHTSVAHVELVDGQPSYRFELTWTPPRPPDLSRFDHVHTGSIAATMAPGADTVRDLVHAARASATISYDPNVRPHLMGNPSAVRERIEQLVMVADVTKASEEDLTWLYPDRTLTDILRTWEGFSPGIAVITRGAQGAVVALRSSHGTAVTHLPAPSATVVDTVGAGDSFMAGFISGLLRSGLAGGQMGRDALADARIEQLRPAADLALAAARATVSRAGAYSPGRREVATPR